MQTLTGTLPGGVVGTLHVMSTESQMTGQSESAIGNFVSTTIPLPESVAFVPTLIGHTQGFAMDAVAAELLGETPGAQQLKTMHFESVKLDRTFDIEVNPRQDEIWLRELFPPSFIDWLAEQAPSNLVFALDHGVLHVGSDDPAFSADALDALARVASRIGSRVRDQCAQEAASGHTTPLAPLTEMQQAAKPRALPSGTGLANLGCSVLASGVFIFGLAFGVTWFLVKVSFGGFPVIGGHAVWAGLAVAVPCTWGVVRMLVTAARSSAEEELLLRPDDADVVSAYGTIHALTSEDPAAFHARVAGLTLPATAAYVLTGRLPIVDRDGSLAVCADTSNPYEPVNWTVFVGRLDDPVSPAAGLQVTTLGDLTAIAGRGTEQATAQELDAFLQKVLELVNARQPPPRG